MPEITISLRDRYAVVLHELAREMDLSVDRVVEQGIAALQAIQGGFWTVKDNHLMKAERREVQISQNASATIEDGVVTAITVKNHGPFPPAEMFDI